MSVDLQGADLANHLAHTLTELEFELLVRERIRREFRMARGYFEQFAESHDACRFVFSPTDACKWHVELGSTYRDCVNLNGEVLHTTMYNAVQQYQMQHGNKLSLLLPAPTDNTTQPENDEIRF